MIRTRAQYFLPIFSLLLFGCTGAIVEPATTPTVTLRPYQLRSVTRTPSPTLPLIPTAPPLGPSPTPLVHVIQSGETLLGIAIRYGVQLEDLLVANPGIDPQLLSIGQELIIPGPEGDPAGVMLPTPTPVEIDLSPVKCYPTPTSNLWCLTTAMNTTGGIIEGLRVLFTLLDQDGKPIAREIANSPLDRIAQGGVMPVAALFKVDDHEGATSYVEVLAALDSSVGTSQYIEVQVIQTTSEPASDHSLWRVEGSVEVPLSSTSTVNSVRLLLIAFDAQDEIVGYAIWETEDEIAQGEAREFEVVVITLGPPIDHVEILSEAQTESG